MDAESRTELLMKFETRNINLFAGCLQIAMPISELANMEKLQRAANEGKTLTVEVNVKRKQRSHNANSYCWALCTEIARVIKGSKEDVYRQAIRSIGTYTPVPIKAEAIERYKEIWQSHGTGWVVDDMGDSKLPGYKVLACYHGSSTYDTKEMSLLIDWLIDEAKQLGVDVISEADKALLVEEWGEKNVSQLRC